MMIPVPLRAARTNRQLLGLARAFCGEGGVGDGDGRLGFTGWTSFWTDGAILKGIIVTFGEIVPNLEHVKV